MPRFFRSNFRGAVKFHEKVAHNMLTAAAVVVRNAAKRNVRGGFTSGDYVSGNIINKIEHVVDARRGRAEVGTTVNYGAYWELGHNNKFTKKYERVEWLKPALKSTAKAQEAAAVKAARRTGGQGGFGLGVLLGTRK